LIDFCALASLSRYSCSSYRWALNSCNHFSRSVQGRRIVDYFRACVAIRFIGKSSSVAGAPLDQHAITGANKLGNDVGRKSHSAFSRQSLAWHSYLHLVLNDCVVSGAGKLTSQGTAGCPKFCILPQ
jgi:hypothetical protein